MASSARAFVVRHAQLRPVAGLEHIRLHLTDDVLGLWRAAQVETGDPGAGLPYWAIAWAGGLALGQYLLEHPGAVAGRSVFDLAAGSGLCGLAALQAGAARVIAADIDPFARAAIRLNARANGARVEVVERDVLDDDPPDVDVIVAGDCWYEAALAARALAWLRRAHERGSQVLVGDPGRAYLPAAQLIEVASYDVRTTSDIENLDQRRARVFTLREPMISGPDQAREPDIAM